MTTDTKIDADLQSVLPITASTNAAGHLTIGGVDTLELARQYGTPLYVFDEADLRDKMPGVHARVQLPPARRQRASTPRRRTSARRSRA